jgi:ATP-binding cassette subfamily C (CFTR/MRP) protein 1
MLCSFAVSNYRVVINYDKIIVLDSGQVLEYDAPTTLLENTNSAFYSLAREAGLAK